MAQRQLRVVHPCLRHPRPRCRVGIPLLLVPGAPAGGEAAAVVVCRVKGVEKLRELLEAALVNGTVLLKRWWLCEDGATVWLCSWLRRL